jgi:hypothetical protein
MLPGLSEFVRDAVGEGLIRHSIVEVLFMNWPVSGIAKSQGSGEPAEKVPWLFSKAGVLVMLFLVLGPFGLVLLYNSPCFSQKAKIWLTVAVMLYAAIIVSVFVIFLLVLSWLVESCL